MAAAPVIPQFVTLNGPHGLVPDARPHSKPQRVLLTWQQQDSIMAQIPPPAGTSYMRLHISVYPCPAVHSHFYYNAWKYLNRPWNTYGVSGSMLTTAAVTDIRWFYTREATQNYFCAIPMTDGEARAEQMRISQELMRYALRNGMAPSNAPSKKAHSVPRPQIILNVSITKVIDGNPVGPVPEDFKWSAVRPVESPGKSPKPKPSTTDTDSEDEEDETLDETDEPAELTPVEQRLEELARCTSRGEFKAFKDKYRYDVVVHTGGPLKRTIADIRRALEREVRGGSESASGGAEAKTPLSKTKAEPKVKSEPQSPLPTPIKDRLRELELCITRDELRAFGAKYEYTDVATQTGGPLGRTIEDIRNNFRLRMGVNTSDAAKDVKSPAPGPSPADIKHSSPAVKVESPTVKSETPQSEDGAERAVLTALAKCTTLQQLKDFKAAHVPNLKLGIQTGGPLKRTIPILRDLLQSAVRDDFARRRLDFDDD